jgi:hypothetical protein
MRIPIATRFLDRAEFENWNALVAASPQGSIYSNTTYLDALCAATGDSFRVLAASRGDELLGGVALYERGSGGTRRVAPRLLLYYNGLVLRDEPSKYPSQRTARLIEATSELEPALVGAGYDGITLKSRSSFSDARVFMTRGWNVRPAYSYVVPLDDLALAWERIEQNLRRLIKRCTAEGLRLSDDDDFDRFYEMHEVTSSRKGTDLYLPREPFRHYVETLRAAGLCRLYHARLTNGRSVAAQLVLLGPNPVSHTVSAATDPDFLSMGATAFLRWKVFEALAELGSKGNDLTDAALNPVSHFKSQLGGELKQCLVLERRRLPRPWRERVRTAMASLRGAP